MNKLALCIFLISLLLAALIPISIQYEHNLMVSKVSEINHETRSNLYCDDGVAYITNINSNGIATNKALVFNGNYLEC